MKIQSTHFYIHRKKMGNFNWNNAVRLDDSLFNERVGYTFMSLRLKVKTRTR